MSNHKTEIDNIVSRILASRDASHITEIYVSNGSMTNGNFKDYVGMMVCYDDGFKNIDLADIIFDINEETRSFYLILSAEPDTVERGHGITLWKRG